MRRRLHFRSQRRRKKLLWIKVFIPLLLLSFLVMQMDSRIRPIIKGLAQNQAIILSTNVINDAITNYIGEKQITYESLMSVSKNTENNVTSIEANTMHINALKAQISTDISDKLKSIKHQPLRIPLGTLIGGELFSGRGPNIVFYISLSGNVKTQVSSEFFDAGINQTLHSIALDITTSIFIICPGYNTSTEMNTNMIVAETVIVGDVPETYNYINTNPDAYVNNYPMMGVED